MRDLGSHITLKRLIAEATATTSPSAVTIDRATVNNNLYEGITFGFFVGAGGITFSGTNYIALKLEESDDSVTYNVVTGSPVADAVQPGPQYGGLVGTGGGGDVVFGAANPPGTNFAQQPDANGFVRLINAAHASADTDPFKVSYVGFKRYIRATIVFGGTHGTGTLVGLVAALGFPANLPPA